MALHPTPSQRSLGIGQWTSTKASGMETGQRFYDPDAQVEYMYVQFNNGAGNLANADNGTPCGVYHFGLNATYTGTSNLRSEMIVTTDVSDSSKLLGFIRNSSSTAVTDGYYGWIALHKPGSKIPNARMVTAAAASDYVVWSADDHLTTTTFASVLAQYADKIGIVCSGVAATTVGTTNYIGDVMCL